MSVVTDIILVTAIEDGAYRPSFDLVKVDQYAGGGKAVQCDVFMSAVNYLVLEDLLDWFKSVRWEYPEQVQLFVKGEHDDKFAVYCPENS